MTVTLGILAIVLYIWSGRYWALTDRPVLCSRFRLNRRSAGAVKAAGSRPRDAQVRPLIDADEPRPRSSTADGEGA